MDRQRILNSLTGLSSVVILVMFQTGFMSAANAFAFIGMIVTGYTAHQLVLRDGEPLGKALVAIIAKPSSYPRRTAWYVYMGCVGIGALVMTQALVA